MNDVTESASTASEGASPTEADSTSVSPDVQAQEQTTEGQSASSEDNFFDPNQVPDELKPVYKGMQSAYTKKTQELAQQRKEIETLRTKADQYSKYEQYIPIVEEMLAKRSTPANQDGPEMAALEQELGKAGYGANEIEFMKVGARIMLGQFNQQLSQRDQLATLQGKVSEAEDLDPRLNDEKLTYTLEDGTQTTFGQIVARFVKADAAWQRDPVAATQRAIKTVDALIGKAKTEGKEELSAAAKKKAAQFSPVSSSPQDAASSGAPKTMREAAELARKQLGQ